MENEGQVWTAYRLRIITLDEATKAIDAIQQERYDVFQKLYLRKLIERKKRQRDENKRKTEKI
jgi:hypothetical protein